MAPYDFGLFADAGESPAFGDRDLPVVVDTAVIEKALMENHPGVCPAVHQLTRIPLPALQKSMKVPVCFLFHILFDCTIIVSAGENVSLLSVGISYTYLRYISQTHSTTLGILADMKVKREAGKVKVHFLIWPSIIISLVLSIVLTIMVNLFV